MKVSVVIGARGEFPNVVHTIHSLINDLEMWTKDFEVILYDQCSEDRTATFLEGRGIVVSGYLKIRYDPIMGNVSTRDKAVRELARGEVVMFCDAHVSVRPGTTKLLYETVKKNPTAIVHPVVEWMGGYPPKGGYQYSVKICGRMWGTWNRLKVADTPFAVPMCGHCFLAISKEQYLAIGGYSRHFQVYGGGEMYLDFKNWMFGGIVLCEPRALVYHLSAGRGYAYHQDQLVHNMFYLSETLGGRRWAVRCKFEYLNKTGARDTRIEELFNQAMAEAVEDKAFIDKNKKASFEQLLDTLPWDEWNRRVHGRANSGILIYDLREKVLVGQPKVEFLDDEEQVALDEEIKTRWGRHIYKGGNE